jgi:hypothetical protein
MENESEVVKVKYAKPKGFAGRGFGNKTTKIYKWDITLFDKENNEFKSGKFCTIRDINEKMNLKLTTDIIWRLTTLSRVDTNKRNKENSFLARFGHIKITKIREPIN